MATIVNNPGNTDSSGGVGMLVGLIVILVVAFLFIVYGIPMVRQATTPVAPQINIPGKIDVNIQGSK